MNKNNTNAYSPKALASDPEIDPLTIPLVKSTIISRKFCFPDGITCSFLEQIKTNKNVNTAATVTATILPILKVSPNSLKVDIGSFTDYHPFSQPKHTKH